MDQADLSCKTQTAWEVPHSDLLFVHESYNRIIVFSRERNMKIFRSWSQLWRHWVWAANALGRMAKKNQMYGKIKRFEVESKPVEELACKREY